MRLSLCIFFFTSTNKHISYYLMSVRKFYGFYLERLFKPLEKYQHSPSKKIPIYKKNIIPCKSFNHPEKPQPLHLKNSQSLQKFSSPSEKFSTPLKQPQVLAPLPNEKISITPSPHPRNNLKPPRKFFLPLPLLAKIA